MKKHLLLLASVFILRIASAQFINLDWAAGTLGYTSCMGFAVTNDASGNVYYTGDFNNMVDFDPGPGTYYMTSTLNSDFYVASLDSSGNFRWAKSFSDGYNARGQAITMDEGNNIIISGTFDEQMDFDPGPGSYMLGTNGRSNQGFICSFDSSGNFRWAKEFVPLSISGAAYTASVVTDGVGHVFLGMSVMDTVIVDPMQFNDTLVSNSAYSGVVMKLDTSGTIMWVKKFTGTESMLYGISLDNDLNVLITGKFSGSVDFDPSAGVSTLTSVGMQTDIFVCKLDSMGNFIWARGMGGFAPDYGSAVVADHNGNVITTGVYMSTADFDPGAGVFNYTASGSYDIFISKLDPNGNFIWAKEIGGTTACEITSLAIAVDTLGNIYSAGHFNYVNSGSFDFDPGPGTFILTTWGDAAFLLALDPAGDFLYAGKMAGQPTDGASIMGMVVDKNSGYLYVTGIFEGNIDFDPGVGNTNLPSNGPAESFVCKLRYDIMNRVAEDERSGDFTVFPNPANDVCYISTKTYTANATVRIITTQGQVLSESRNHSGHVFEIDVRNLPPAVYIIEIETAGQISHRRILHL